MSTPTMLAALLHVKISDYKYYYCYHLPVLDVNVPYFDGSSSFLSFPTLTNSFSMTFLYLDIRPASPDGLILLNRQLNGPDFIAIALRGGRVELWYNLGQGVVNITSRDPVSLDEWHTVQISRSGRNGDLMVDDAPSVSGTSPGTFTLLQLSSDLYVGGAPMPSSLPVQLRILSGYHGCVRELRVARFVNSRVDLIPDARSGQGVTECPVLSLCGPDTCQNGGTCTNTVESFVCECAPGFTGGRCEVDLCTVSNPCQNNGVCYVESDNPSLLLCNCSAPFAGPMCTESKLRQDL